MSVERPHPSEQMQVMFNFTQRGREGLVNNFCLKGPIDADVNFHTFAGFFPNPDLLSGSLRIVSSKKEPEKRPELLTKILNLELPQRVADKNVVDDLGVRTTLEQRSALSGEPSIMLGFGRAKDTGEEVMVLFSVAGMSPQTALAQLQEITRARLAQLQ